MIAAKKDRSTSNGSFCVLLVIQYILGRFFSFKNTFASLPPTTPDVRIVRGGEVSLLFDTSTIHPIVF